MNRLLKRGRKAAELVKNPLHRRGLLHGVGACIEHREFLQWQKFSTLLDIGANMGQFSLMARSIHPNARIYAFEPVPHSAQKYRQIFADDPAATLYEVALGSHKENREMYVPSRVDCSSFIAAHIGSDPAEKVNVPIETLDSLFPAGTLEKPILLKADVQGFELEVLKGGTRLLSEIDNLIVEVTFNWLTPETAPAHEVVAWMKEHGFDLVGVYNALRMTTRHAIADFHFRRHGLDGA